MQSYWSRLRRDDRATSAVEFSIVAPLFILLIFLVIQAGLYFYGRNVAQTSAREGVSFLRLAGTSPNTQAFKTESGRVAEVYATRIGMLKGVKATPYIDTETGRVKMTVTGTLRLPGGDMKISQTADATLEQFRGDERGEGR